MAEPAKVRSVRGGCDGASVALAVAGLALACGGAGTPLERPAPAPSRLPRLASDARGGLAISWVEEARASDGGVVASLRFAAVRDGGWSAPAEIARGSRWFVNWADFPALAIASGEVVLASFLERTGVGTFDYRVLLARSADGGATWSEPVRLHDHAGPGEHGFVSLAPAGDGGCIAVWLDGRNARGGHGDEGGGAMALFAREVRPDGALGPESAVDERVCDCCSTAAVRAADGSTLIAYRDRGVDERRDVTIARRTPGGDAETVWDSADGWRIAGCPVNGPALASDGDRVGVAWFTLGADGAARVLSSRSEDGGRSFSAPIPVAGGRALGRVDAEFDARGRLAVLWLEETGLAAEWRLARVDGAGRARESEPVAAAAADRTSGFAQLARAGERLFVAWTEPGDPPRVAVRELP